jgi:hypothetical protein
MQRRCQRVPCEGRLLGSVGFAGRPGKTHHTIMKSIHHSSSTAPRLLGFMVAIDKKMMMMMKKKKKKK